MVTTILRLKIHYAPLPEENTRSSSSSPTPAALEYCQRAARLFLSVQEEEGDRHGQNMIKREVVGIEPLPDDASRLFDTTTCNYNQEDDTTANCSDTKESTAEKNKATTTTRTLHLFIISCAADGSVHRSARKFARSLANLNIQEKHNDIASSLQQQQQQQCCYFALTLLGHARCDNSAKQMADTIYSAGWRLEKSLLALQATRSSITATTTFSRCETQVELEGPEIKFDPWFMMTLLAAQSLS
jgi:hypothetical protein